MKKIQRKATSNQDEIIVNLIPVVVLIKYTSNNGNVQINSNRLKNLEQDYFMII